MTLRQKLVPSYFTGIIGAAIGLIVGIWIVYGLVWRGVDSIHPPDGNNFQEQGLILGFTFLMVGWLIGIGALNYPISWLLSRPDPTHEDELRLAGKDAGVWRYFRFTTDHNVVGIPYLVLTLIMLALGGLGAMLIRLELIRPGAKLFGPGTYNTIVSMH